MKPGKKKGSDYMPYGVTQQQWDTMNDYGRHLAKRAYDSKQPTATTSSTSSSIPQSTWDQMPANIKSNIISTAQATGIDPTPGQIAGVAGTQPTPPITAEQPLVQQQPYDPYVMIKELQEEQTRQQIAALNAAKTKPIRGLSKAMAKAIG
jgi:hypothetical protein